MKLNSLKERAVVKLKQMCNYFTKTDQKDTHNNGCSLVTLECFANLSYRPQRSTPFRPTIDQRTVAQIRAHNLHT